MNKSVENIRIKNITVVLIVLVFIGIFLSFNTVYAAAGDYKPLVPLEGIRQPNTSSGSVDFSDYASDIIKYIIGVAGILAVIMIVVGGIQYMSTDAIGGKNDGKEKITYAIGGLILAIIAYIILNTINPNLLKFDLNPRPTGAPTGQIVLPIT